jgi:signal transduction histidine kinase
VSSPPSTLQRLAGFFFAGAPALALPLMLGGLYLADRILVRSDDAHIAADANLTAARVQQFVAVQVATLESFQALFSIPDPEFRRREFRSLIDLAGVHEPGLDRIRIESVDNSVVLDSTIGRPELATYGQLGPDAMPKIAGAVARAYGSRHVTITPSTEFSAGKYGFGIVVPVVRADSVIGVVIGLVTMDAILAVVGADGRSTSPASDSRRLLVITSLAPAGGREDLAIREDTVIRFADSRSAMMRRSGEAVITMPAGDRWKVQVVHAAIGWPIRVALWGIGLAALWALTVGSLRERDQSRRIAERSEELEHLSTELLHANRAKSEFLANVSHELRTPLNAIVGFVELLRDGVYGELAPRQISPVDRIAASATHLRHLVDQVLDLAKITAGRLEVHTDVVDLRAFVLSVASEMESLVTERGLALSLAVAATLPRIRTDPTHLRQILVNLIGNAIKYTNAGTVLVRARLVGLPPDNPRSLRMTPDGVPLHPTSPPADGVWVAIQVVDTGIGIAAVDRDRIFDEFEQVGAGPRGDSMRRGTGLGLSISRRLARLLGGDVVVDSELGKGSTFTLWLPLGTADLHMGEASRLTVGTSAGSDAR